MATKRKLYKVTHVSGTHRKTLLIIETKRKKAKGVAAEHLGAGDITVKKVPLKKGVVKAFEPEIKIAES